MLLFVSNGDFDEILEKYELGLKLTLVISSLAFMLIFYSMLNRDSRKKRIELTEKAPIVRWSYSELYWRSFKDKEFLKRGLLYAVKLLLIWLPVVVFLLVIYNAEPAVAAIVSICTFVFTVPIIPFTLGKFLGEMKNQLFHDEFEVNIYKNGLTINGVYYPYNYYNSSDDNIKLVKIEKLSLYSADCIKFTARKQFYSPPTLDGGDSGSMMTRTKSILIPIPKNGENDLRTIKKQIGLEKIFP